MREDVQEKVLKAIAVFRKQEPSQLEALPVSGSERQYFRIFWPDKTMIAAYSQSVRENKAFVAFTRHFLSKELPVPKLYFVHPDNDVWLMEDLGNQTLLDLVSGYSEEALRTIYQQALKGLMAFQVIGHQGLRYDEAYPVSRFDKTSIKWDLYYFKYYFLHVSGLSYDEQELEKGFDILANAIVQEDTDFFMYRDFQARNIMVKDGKLRYIDYQGGRMGHPLYDVVSLLYQARAGLSEALRNDLFGYYLDEIHKNYSVTTSRFPAVYPYLKLLRFLQVLGAYGFRGRIQRKSHFLKSIPHALENLHNLITAPDFPSELATLANILKNMIAESRKSEAQKTGSLNILVYSFSYKKAGMLSDSSGNGGGFVFDCRSLPNPGRYEAFKYLTGKDAPVISFLEARQEVQDFIDQSFQVVMPSIENYLSRGFEHLMVGFGCTGGQHRSVFCAEKFAEAIRQKYALSVTVKHYQQDQENNNSGKKS